MDGKVVWQGKMAFDGSVATQHVKLDADAAVGGEGDGFKPMQLIAIGLAGCTAMDVISILRKKRQDISEFEVRVHAEQASDHPHVFTHIRLEYVVTGRSISADALQRAIELSETKYCPAQAMLNKIVPIELTYTINEIA